MLAAEEDRELFRHSAYTVTPTDWHACVIRESVVSLAQLVVAVKDTNHHHGMVV